MKAARWYARGDVRVVDVPDPGAPPPGWLRLKVLACGICGTDVEEYTAGPVLTPVTPHPLTGRCAPLTLGHEFVGVVDAVGPDTPYAAGDTVAVDGTMSCGTCDWCRAGRYNMCAVSGQLGQQGDGGLAEYALAPASCCVAYAGIPATTAAFAEPLSVAVRAVSRGEVAPGATVAVVGGGTVGLLTARVAVLAGASRVVVVEPHPHRRGLAAHFGAEGVAPDDAPAGMDVVFEAAGVPAVASAAVRMTGRAGTTVLLSVFDDDVAVPMLDLLLGEKRLVASLSHLRDADFPRAVELLCSGDVDPRPLISDRVPLSEVVPRGLDALVADPARHLKILVEPWE